jgi:hypothetical protein
MLCSCFMIWDLKSSMPLFMSLENLIVLVIFMIVIIWTDSHQASFCYFNFNYPFVLISCLHQGNKFLCPWEKSLLFLRILNTKIKHFMNLLFICKPIKLQLVWDTFLQHNPNQKTHGLAYLTSLITHIQNFEVLSMKCVWSSNFILIGIQLARPKLDSSTLYCHAQTLFGLHLCWNISHPYSMTLQHFLTSSMLVSKIWTKNAHLTSNYNIFVDHYNKRCPCMASDFIWLWVNSFIIMNET